MAHWGQLAKTPESAASVRVPQKVRTVAAGPDDDGGDIVKKFPEPYSPERVAAQKRLAQQFMVQMPKDPREQRQVLRYMTDLVDWQEAHNGEGSVEQPQKNREGET